MQLPQVCIPGTPAVCAGGPLRARRQAVNTSTGRLTASAAWGAALGFSDVAHSDAGTIIGLIGCRRTPGRIGSGCEQACTSGQVGAGLAPHSPPPRLLPPCGPPGRRVGGWGFVVERIDSIGEAHIRRLDEVAPEISAGQARRRVTPVHRCAVPSLPTQTPTHPVFSRKTQTNQASRKFWLVPVLPGGKAARRRNWRPCRSRRRGASCRSFWLRVLPSSRVGPCPEPGPTRKAAAQSPSAWNEGDRPGARSVRCLNGSKRRRAVRSRQAHLGGNRGAGGRCGGCP